MEPKWVLKWDYNIPNGYIEYVDTQTEWNQTLITRINQISAKIHICTLRWGADTLEMNSKVFEIVKTLGYYRPETNSIGDRYSIIINEGLGCEILIYSSKHSLKPSFIASCEKGDTKINDNGELETELIDVEFKHVTESNEEEIKEYQNNLFGILKIINYENPV